MENIAFYNGNWVDGNLPQIKTSNRLYCYGDGIFETIRVIFGKVFEPMNHYARLEEGAKALGITLPDYLDKESYLKLLNEIIEKNSIKEGARIRLTLSRGEGGYYLPENDMGEVYIEIQALEQNQFELNEEGIILGEYPKPNKNITPYSPYKTGNGLLYIMAAKYAQEQGWGDVLILNTKASIIESYNSNVFISSNGVLYTPGLDEGCMGGTMRMNIINMAIDHGIKVYECRLIPQNILVADELFLTNAIQGIKWVGEFKSKRYKNDMSKRLTALLNKKAQNL